MCSNVQRSVSSTLEPNHLISKTEVTIYLPTRRKYLIIECTDLKTRRESLWKLKNTKNKVLDSDIAYILMISIDIDGDSTRFPAILPDVKVFLTKSNILRSKNRPQKSKITILILDQKRFEGCPRVNFVRRTRF